ncbi:MAG TPA: hypothetical protein ENJ95_16560 [Bacteroidetes bacterium]|nr:hypothetical protein [Bacteroidota bacterium]
MKNLLNLLLIAALFSACNGSSEKKHADSDGATTKKTAMNKLSGQAIKVRDYVPDDMVFAHRGSTYWTPEETEASLRWARNIGADYLEFDLQKTKDGFLIALHDSNLSRTSNVREVFPERADSAAIYFTLKELRQLDIGSWFNGANPDRARKAYAGLKILTFKDVIKIAEGYRLKKGKDGLPEKEIKDGEWTGFYIYEKDPQDNGNRPGLYAETKKPDCEKLIAKELTETGWNINKNSKTIKTTPGKIGLANTNGRFILQTFSPESAIKLEALLPNIPKCLLLWQPEMKDDLKGNYQKAIDFCIKNNVHFIGSSIAGPPNNYKELNAPWMVDMVHGAGLKIHAYTFDTWEQFKTYGKKVDGAFTNRSDIALEFYGRKSEKSAEDILKELGY